MNPNAKPYIQLSWRGEPIENVREWALAHDTPLIVVRETVTVPMTDGSGFRVAVNFYVVPGILCDGMPKLVSASGSSRVYTEMGALKTGETLDDWLAERDAS